MRGVKCNPQQRIRKPKTEEQRTLHNLRQKIWVTNNPDKAKGLHKRYYELHKGDQNTKRLALVKLQKQAGIYSGLQRKWALRKNYGMTPEQYNVLLVAQNNVCAICQKLNTGEKFLHVDHDHKTGLVRGLLCRRCNLGISFFNDDPLILETVIGYLKQPPAQMKVA